MTKITWGNTGERIYETGVDRAVFYPRTGSGVAWNGLVSVEEVVSGGDVKPVYLDGKKLYDQVENEDCEIDITTISVPNEFLVCAGIVTLVPGLFVTHQPRAKFGFCYRTIKGNDVSKNDYAYKIHLIYNATVPPTSRSYETISDSSNLNPLKWTLNTVPPDSSTFKPSAHLIVDTSLITSTKRTSLENLLYGTSTTSPSLPTQAAVISLLT